MSPTAIAASLVEGPTEPEPGAPTDAVISLPRRRFVVLALLWLALASAFGGLAASAAPALRSVAQATLD
jgi:hypothetical protein